MAMHPDIRDQAYQFFVEEAPELLQALETGLLTLSQGRDTTTVHGLMRAAHSIKGGAASVGLEAIAAIAHRLENIFKALYGDTVEIDAHLESQLLQAYDCLRLPLMEQLTAGGFDTTAALAAADPIFNQIEEQFGEALLEADYYIPSSAELGVDIVTSIFEVDVAQGLQHLATVLTQPQDYELVGELRAQAEVFAGFGELLNLPSFGAIADSVQRALNAHPDRAMEIAQLALIDFEQSRQVVLAGDRMGTGPSASLLALAGSAAESPLTDGADWNSEFEAESVAFPEALMLENFDRAAFDRAVFDQAAFAQMEFNPEEFNSEEFNSEELSLEEFDQAEFNQAETSSETPLEEGPIEAIQASLPLLELLFGDSQVPLATSEALTDDENLEADSELIHETFSDSEAHDWTDGELAQWQAFNSEFNSELNQEFNQELNQELNREFNQELNPLTNSDLNLESSLELNSELDRSPTHDRNPDLNSGTLDDSDSETEDATSDNSLEMLQAAAQSLAQLIDYLPATAEPLELARSLTPEQESLESRSFTDHSESSQSEESEQSEQLEQSEQAAQSEQAERAGSDRISSPPALKPELTQPEPKASPAVKVSAAPNLTVRVDATRLERMNNLVGELAINRDAVALQNEQLQEALRALLNRFTRFQTGVNQLRELSDQSLVASERLAYRREVAENMPLSSRQEASRQEASRQKPGDGRSFPAMATPLVPGAAEFDSLEMDRYGTLHTQIQEILEEMVQLEEIVEDIDLFAQQSNQTLDQQRHMLIQLRDEVMWARMLPLSEILNRFPRVLRDLSTTYQKPVGLKLVGTGVLVEKAILEKLYDPLVHLLRNAFDHGIEAPEIRRQQGKPEQGQIEIRAYHKGNQTVIEVRDDGRGLDLERIRDRAIELGKLTPAQGSTLPPTQLYRFIFEPGFSTARRVSELSGRGVGLDVVQSQIQAIKGSVTVTSTPGQGTLFTLSLPLTLTIVKLIVCSVGATVFALPTDSIEEIVTPRSEQVQQLGNQRRLTWRDQTMPVYRLSDLLAYACPLPDTTAGSKLLAAMPMPKDWALPMMILRYEQQLVALEVDRLVTEQELVIKPFGSALAPPGFLYGCTILGDGSLIPVIDGLTLLSRKARSESSAVLDESVGSENGEVPPTVREFKTVQAPTILVVDDAATLRRTLALSLKRVGYRVLQARDGQEAIGQLQQSSAVQLVICDIEMPNMNGFEFLSYRRQTPDIARIPIVMLTSRSNEKHRWLAMQLGAEAYFTKPYLEQEFLSAIQEILDRAPAQTLA